jgi:hypothetical protein
LPPRSGMPLRPSHYFVGRAVKGQSNAKTKFQARLSKCLTAFARDRCFYSGDLRC